MRALERPALPFPDLRRETETLIASYAGSAEFHSRHWRHPRVLGALFALHGRGCAYCQGPFSASDRGDVDHFRPKSIYWWLAYDVSNYFLSCGRCNRVRKGDRFPLAEGEVGLRHGDGRREQDEKKLLLDPSRDDVRRIVLRLEGGFWSLAAKTSDGVPDAEAATTIRFFELNLGLLPVERQRALADALEEARLIRANQGDPTRLKKLASSFAPFSDPRGHAGTPWSEVVGLGGPLLRPTCVGASGRGGTLGRRQPPARGPATRRRAAQRAGGGGSVLTSRIPPVGRVVELDGATPTAISTAVEGGFAVSKVFPPRSREALWDASSCNGG